MKTNLKSFPDIPPFPNKLVSAFHEKKYNTSLINEEHQPELSSFINKAFQFISVYTKYTNLLN